MHIHILGIGGTFMGGLALLARELGHQVTGTDAAMYPPMSTQLANQGIICQEGYSPANLAKLHPDQIIIGNSLSRGNPAVEYVLNQSFSYTSGPQWLADHLLSNRWVLAVAGTHGKTTTTSLLAWILETAGLQPGFLIGGIAKNFGLSARLGQSPFFVVEADEYDTAFFDKRPKLLHYRPRTAIINNLEFDHADIYPDLAAIQQQMHYFIRTIPGEGLLIHKQQASIQTVLAQGCWSFTEMIGGEGSHWQARALTADNSEFEVYHSGQLQGKVNWSLIGQHNVENGLAAIAAAQHAGVPIRLACEALASFRGVKRRLELRGNIKEISIYDDFAHHPTAIAMTLHALRQKVGLLPITVVLELRSNTMRMGIHQHTLAAALQEANKVLIYEGSNLEWSLSGVTNSLKNAKIFTSIPALIDEIKQTSQPGEQILIMSNGGFENIHQRLLTALAA